MKKLICLTLSLLLLLTSCTPVQEVEEGGLLLYYTRGREAGYGSALDSEYWTGEEDPTPEKLLRTLFAGPADEGLSSPFPKGVSVQAVTLEEDGLLRLTLSEQYGGLSDISRTLADACIVMTVCQLPGVERVEISSAGGWTGAPASRTVSPDQLDTRMLLP